MLNSSSHERIISFVPHNREDLRIGRKQSGVARHCPVSRDAGRLGAGLSDLHAPDGGAGAGTIQIALTAVRRV